MNDDIPMRPLTEGEIDQLIRQAPAALRTSIARLCAELRTLREQAGERERMHAEEVAW